jgi:hypothetical protein
MLQRAIVLGDGGWRNPLVHIGLVLLDVRAAYGADLGGKLAYAEIVANDSATAR